MNQGKITSLIDKYLRGKASNAEEESLLNWYKSFQKDKTWNEEEMGDFKETRERIFNNVIHEIDNREKQVKPKKLNWLLIAASIITVIGLGVYLNNPTLKTDHTTTAIIQPGSNKATLTLDNGRKITLTDVENGKILEKEGVTITKTADGMLVYNCNERKTNAANQLGYNIIETPRGGQYQVILPDGTKVWLNAASSLKYPTQFSSNQRKVKLSGEAYFEVAHDKEKPFIVATAMQQITVLGTHFNVNAYPDELKTKTTLLEGAVSLQPNEAAAAQFLKPGQQAVLSADKFEIHTVSTEEAIAWKEGYFLFDNEDIKSAMRKLARWYDLDISFQGDLDNIYFGGSFSRSNSLKETLNILESTNKFKCKIEGRRMTIIK